VEWKEADGSGGSDVLEPAAWQMVREGGTIQVVTVDGKVRPRGSVDGNAGFEQGALVMEILGLSAAGIYWGVWIWRRVRN